MPARCELAVQTSRVTAIDGLRGLLAVVVLAWHVTPDGPPWLLMLADVAVAMFFVLSGAVLARAWDGRLLVFLVRRVIRLWPVYALCLSLGYMIAGVPPVWSEFLWYPLIKVETQPFIDPPVWSLFLEVWIMPFMPLIVWAGAGTVWRAVLCMSGLIAASFVVPQIGVGVLFVAGAFVSRADVRSRVLEAPLLQALGRMSYSLYLSHWPLIGLAVRIFGPWGGVLVLPVLFAVAAAMWWGVERPSIWASRRVGRLIADVLDHRAVRHTMVQTGRPERALTSSPVTTKPVRT